MQKLDLKTLCQRCQVVRRWRRDGSRNVMGLAAGLNNLAHQPGVCLGQSQGDSQPTPEQRAELKQCFRFTAPMLLQLLEDGDMLGTWTAEWWMLACEQCRAIPAAAEDCPKEDVNDGLSALRAGEAVQESGTMLGVLSRSSDLASISVAEQVLPA